MSEDEKDFEVSKDKGKDREEKDKKKQKKAKKDKTLKEDMEKAITTTEEPSKGKKKKGGKKKDRDEAEGSDDEHDKRKSKGKRGKKGRDREEDEEPVKEKEETSKTGCKDKEEPSEETEDKKEDVKDKSEEDKEVEPKEEKKVKKKPVKDSRMPIEVFYCAICSRPADYCEYSDNPDECKRWWFKNHKDIYEETFGAEVPKTEEMGDKKEEGKEEEKAAKKKKKVTIKEDKKIIVTRTNRGKHTYLTQIYGLHLFGVNLKDAAKMIRKDMATGAAIVEYEKDPSQECIQIQGDARTGVEEFITANYAVIPKSAIVIKEVDAKKK